MTICIYSDEKVEKAVKVLKRNGYSISGIARKLLCEFADKVEKGQVGGH